MVGIAPWILYLKQNEFGKWALALKEPAVQLKIRMRE